MTSKPTDHEHEAWEMLDRIQMDVRDLSAKIVALRSMMASLNLPVRTRVRCRHCGLSLAGEKALAEHLYISHDGVEPEHWLEAEAKAEIADG